MTRKLVSAIMMLALTAIVAVASSQEQAKKPAPEPWNATFAVLRERAKKSDPTLDFKELRMSFTETTEYNPYGGDRETRKQMFAALNAKEYDKAVESAEKILAKNFVEINSHFAAYVSHRELGHGDKSAFHKFMFDGLVKSITGSGDGKTADTAYVVISTDEEYTLFNVLGIRATDQSLLSQNGHSYDRMTTVDPKTSETVVYFFNIDKPFNWLGRSLKK